jgi:hypothetical protein
MKATHEIQVYVHIRLNKEGEPDISLSRFQGMEDYYGKLVAIVPIQIEYDPLEAVVAEIELLKEEEQTLQAETHKKVMTIRDKIQSLLAIDYTPEPYDSAQEPCPAHSSEGGPCHE